MIIAYPVLIFSASTLYPQTLAGFLVLLVINLLHSKETSRIALAGVASGYLCLCVPLLGTIVPFFIFWPWAIGENRPELRRRGIYMACCALVVGIWTGRNYVAFDKFLPISSNSGVNLLLGNSVNTTANSGTNVDISRQIHGGKRLSELEQDRYYIREALQWVLENKLDASWLYFKKAINFFNFRNELRTKTESSLLRSTVMFLSYYTLLILALTRILLRMRYPLDPFEVLLLVLYLWGALVSAMFFTRIRFRLPFDFLLLAFIGSFFGRHGFALWKERVSD